MLSKKSLLVWGFIFLTLFMISIYVRVTYPPVDIIFTRSTKDIISVMSLVVGITFIFLGINTKSKFVKEVQND